MQVLWPWCLSFCLHFLTLWVVSRKLSLQFQSVCILLKFCFWSIIKASLWPWTSQPWLESERWLHCSPICLIIRSALISDRGRAQPWAAPPSHLIISLSLQPFLEGCAYPEFWPFNQPSLPYCIMNCNGESCVIQKNCVTRAPLLYFIRSWVAKSVSESVRHR